jgi:putative flippase GtrA
VIVGGANTALTYVLFMLLIRLLPYIVAYSIVYAIGIVFSYFASSLFAFKKSVSVRSFLLYPIVYIFQYLWGLLLLWVGVEMLGVNPEIMMLVVIVSAIPITYLLSKLIISGVRQRA